MSEQRSPRFTLMDKLLDEAEKTNQLQVRDNPDWSFVLSADSGLGIMKDMLGVNEEDDRVKHDPDNDVLFRFRGVPVRVRHDLPHGGIMILPNVQIPASRCCDVVCMQMVFMATARGHA